MQKVRVDSIKLDTGEKDGNKWTKTTITGEDGSQFSGFDTKLSRLTPGALIEVEPEIKGKYINIKSWKLLEEGERNLGQFGHSPKLIDQQINADFKVAALQVAGRLAASGKIEQGDIKSCAHQLLAWLADREETKKSPQTSKAERDDPEELWPGETVKPGELNTLAQLELIAYNRWRIKPAELYKQLGYARRNECTVPPFEAFCTLKELYEEK